jgi:hypothetical protein
MANRVEIEVRLKIVLATEQFGGRYHTGANSTSYMLNHPVTIFAENDSDRMKWMQHRDRQGHFDDRLPGNGLVSINQGDCQLNDMNGKPVVTLSNFAAPIISSSGVADYKYKRSTYQTQKDSQINWVGRGAWELVEDKSDPPAPRYLTSAWTFNTSASASVGGLVVEFGSGVLVFDDPSKITHRFAYLGGGGSVDLGKVLKLVKALKNLVWVEKVAKATDAVGKVSGGSSTEDMFSTGAILKNVAVVGTRELTKEDFLGGCLWIDASVGIYKSVGGMLLLTNVSSIGPIPTFRACVPCCGVNYTPVAAGLGACAGWISPA